MLCMCQRAPNASMRNVDLLHLFKALLSAPVLIVLD